MREYETSRGEHAMKRRMVEESKSIAPALAELSNFQVTNDDLRFRTKKGKS